MGPPFIVLNSCANQIIIALSVYEKSVLENLVVREPQPTLVGFVVSIITKTINLKSIFSGISLGGSFPGMISSYGVGQFIKIVLDIHSISSIKK